MGKVGERLVRAAKQASEMAREPLCAAFDEDCYDIKDKHWCRIALPSEGKCPFPSAYPAEEAEA